MDWTEAKSPTPKEGGELLPEQKVQILLLLYVDNYIKYPGYTHQRGFTCLCYLSICFFVGLQFTVTVNVARNIR